MAKIEKETTATPEKKKMVKIRLPLTKEEKSPVFVSVNDRTWLIKRGEEVEVPECVVEVLKNQEIMLTEAYKFEESHNDKKG